MAQGALDLAQDDDEDYVDPYADESDDEVPVAGALDAGGGDYDDDVGGGALGLGAPQAESAYDKTLAGLGAAFAGNPEDIKGALQQRTAAKNAADAQRLELIRSARERMASAGQGNVNLPMLAAAGALSGAPNLSRGLGEAFTAAVPQIQLGRQMDIARAQRLGNLDLLEGNTGVQSAQQNYQDLLNQLKMGTGAYSQAAKNQAYREMFAARERRAQELIAAQNARAEQASRDRAAVLAQQAKRDAEAVRRDDLLADYRDQTLNRNRYERKPGMGPDPNDPKKQVLGTLVYDRMTNAPATFYPGEIQSPTGTGRKTVPQFYHDEFIEAYKNEIKDPIELERRALEFAKSGVGMTPQTALSRGYSIASGMIGPDRETPDQQKARIKANAEEIAQTLLAPRTGGGTPAAASAPPPVGHMLRNAPLRQPGTPVAAPAAAPQAAPAAAPAKIPARAPGTPLGAKYSPSQNRYWWKEGGQWKSAPPAGQ